MLHMGQNISTSHIVPEHNQHHFEKLQQVSHSGLTEKRLDFRRNTAPAMVRETWVRIRAGGASQQTASIASGQKRRHDPSEGQLIRGIGQMESAIASAHRLQHAGPGQRVHRLREVVARAFERRGDIVDSNGRVFAMFGDIEYGAQRVSSSTVEPHRRCPEKEN